MSGKFKQRQRHTPSFRSIGKCKYSELASPNKELFGGIKENMIPLIQRAFSALPSGEPSIGRKQNEEGKGK